MRKSALTVSKGRKLLSEAKVMKQSVYLFCLTLILGGGMGMVMVMAGWWLRHAEHGPGWGSVYSI